VLRRSGATPARAVSYDRFGHPKVMRAARKPGVHRATWCQEVMESAACALEVEGTLRGVEGGKGHRYTRVVALAQDRDKWKKWVDKWRKSQDWVE